MKYRRKSFGVKLWRWFLLFAAVIFAALWLLQTVFLQSFYDSMTIRNVERAAQEITARQDGEELFSLLDRLARENSLLILVTDEAGELLYGTDEHSGVYGRRNQREGSGGENPYSDSDRTLSWQIGAGRNLSLPQDYSDFLQQLSDSGGQMGYRLEEASAYVCGRSLSGGRVLYISTSLGTVGSAVIILRTQLLWVTAASVLLAAVIAAFMARRFSRPVAALSEQAVQMAGRHFDGSFERGFCAELDELADTLTWTAAEIAGQESFRREFLANVSHDLRTPLTMIRGYAEMVRDFSWEDAGQREQDLAVIIREADRLTGLVNDILDYTALQEETRPVRLEAVDLSGTAGEVIEQFGPLCAHRGYRLEADIPPGLTVSGDRKQLARVLYNLIDNAVSHAGENRRVQVRLQAAGGVVRAEVRDFGSGIAPEDLPHIWERYFTLKQQKRNESSSGLGLAISREILLTHGAQFGVESAPGQGSLFWFELPERAAR